MPVKKFIFLIVTLISWNGLARPKSGLKIESFETGSVYQQLGFEKGDVVKKINGKNIDTPEALKAGLKEIKNGDKIDVIVERNGKETTLHYTIK